MTVNKDWKKLVRKRMVETGQTYMQARQALIDEREQHRAVWTEGGEGEVARPSPQRRGIVEGKKSPSR